MRRRNRFSDPVPVLVRDRRGRIKSGSKEQHARMRRMRRGMQALHEGDRETYIKLVWDGKDPDEAGGTKVE